uniref:Topoisomerase I damage affected protein 7-like isoform X2 n=1 Tax=Crassostrea virginica TaxID=6565 RepID=A0A8B8AHI3_CRAVI|nr:topoisomerase I damage affected protein 7-like isoform X2 [Crassostrea virginica]
MEMIYLIFLTFVGFVRSLENRCLNFANTSSLRAISFCKNETLISNETIILNAFQPVFGFDSTFCMCEVKILSSQSTSSLYIKEEPSLIPVAECGLEIKLEDASNNLDTVTCTSYLDKEWMLRKYSTLVFTLTNTSVNFFDGFCFALALRFESSPMSVRCFSPGITIIPTFPTPSLETTTSGFMSENTFSVKPETTTCTKTSTTRTPSTQTSDYPSVTHSVKTTKTGFTEQTPSSTVAESSSETPKSTSVHVTPIPDTVATTTTNSDKQRSTTTVVAGLTDQVTLESDTTPGGTFSTTRGDTTISVAMEVRDGTEFNVLYVIIPVLALLLIGIFCLIVIWQNDNKGNAYRQERLQSSVPSSLDTDHFYQSKTDVKTSNSNNMSGMKEEPSFFFHEDQHIQEPVSDIYAKPKPKPGRYTNNNQNKTVALKDTKQDGKMKTNSHSRPHDPNVVYVTVNGGERFVL